MTLRHRLLLVYGAGGAVPLLLLAGLGLGLLARTIQAQVDRDVRRTAAAAADLLHARIHYYLQEAVQISPYRSVYAARLEAEGYAAEWTLPAALAGWAVAVRTALVEPHPPLRRAILLDADGAPRYRVEPHGYHRRQRHRRQYSVETRHFTPADREGFPPEGKGASDWAWEVAWREDSVGFVRRCAVPLAYPGTSDQFLLFDLSLPALVEELERKLGPAARLILFDPDTGVLLWHPDPARRGQALAVAEPALAPAVAPTAGTAGVARAVVAGEESALGYWRDDERGLIIAAAAPLAPALAPFRRVAGWTLGGLGVILVVAFLALLRFSRRFAGRVDRLVEGTAAFARDDLAHRIPVREEDEIGRVGRALNTMAADLAASREQLRRQERLAVLGELSGALAHEVKNPLQSIAASAETLRRKGEEPGVREKCLRFIGEETRRLGDFLSRFLDLGRPKALDRRPCDLRGPLRRAVEIALAGEAGRRVRVVEEFPADVPPVPVDEAQILQAFLNVVLNAVEAMPATGTLRLRLHPEADVMEVKIVDSGIGIPPAVRDRLFEPFVSGRPQGSGLGLAIVKRIVEAHGGTVRAAAAEGEGTAFTIRLPRETG